MTNVEIIGDGLPDFDTALGQLTDADRDAAAEANHRIEQEALDEDISGLITTFAVSHGIIDQTQPTELTLRIGGDPISGNFLGMHFKITETGIRHLNIAEKERAREIDREIHVEDHLVLKPQLSPHASYRDGHKALTGREAKELITQAFQRDPRIIPVSPNTPRLII